MRRDGIERGRDQQRRQQEEPEEAPLADDADDDEHRKQQTSQQIAAGGEQMDGADRLLDRNGSELANLRNAGHHPWQLLDHADGNADEHRLDAHLAAHGPYVCGEKISAVDFYATMLMRWSRNMPKPATEWSSIAGYVARMKSRPSFRVLYQREGLTEWS